MRKQRGGGVVVMCTGWSEPGSPARWPHRPRGPSRGRGGADRQSSDLQQRGGLGRVGG